jgi:hypothetical protein
MTTRRAARIVLILAIALTLTTACGGSSSAPSGAHQAHARWDANGPHHYRYTWHKRAMAGVSRIIVEVRDGNVVKTTVARDDLKVMAAGGAPSVEAVFAELGTAEANADTVEVSYDHDLGYPLSVWVDVSTRSIDDEYEFGVQDLQPL